MKALIRVGSTSTPLLVTLAIASAITAIVLFSHHEHAEADIGPPYTDGIAELRSGVSEILMLNGTPERFSIRIDHPTQLMIASEHFSGISSDGNRIEGKLYNASGKMVAKASSVRGHFVLTEQLPAGNYVLEVTGWAPSGLDNNLNIYQLSVNC